MADQVDTLGNRLRARRLEKGLSMAKLAVESGVSKVTIVKLETGQQTNPRLRTLEDLAVALEVGVAQLLPREGARDYMALTRPFREERPQVEDVVE